MMSQYDVIVIGAGHNGLTAASYLAKAGKKVLILERKSYVGGGVSTRELNTPGFWHDEHSSVHIMIQGNPMIRQDELGLFSKFGLKYNYSDVPYASVYDDGSSIICYKDLDKACESIAQISPKDAETYRKLAQKAASLLPMFLSGFYSPPLPMGAMVAMLDQSEEGREMFDYMQRSTYEIVNRLFVHDKVKVHLLRVLAENLQLPDELGTGMGLFVFVGIMHTYGVSQPVGGSGKLSEALERCFKHYGGEVRLDAEVKKVLTSNGKAVGVEMRDGEKIYAKDGVIGALHPHVIDRFIDGLDENVVRRAKNASLAPFSLFVSHYDLHNPAEFYAHKDVSKGTMLTMLSTENLSELMDDFDELRRGKVSKRRLVAGGDESLNDPTRVPAGKGMFHGITFAPYDLAEGGSARWDEYKEEFGELSLAAYRKYVKNLTSDNIIARSFHSPLDLERSSPNSMVRGDVHGVAPYFYQCFAHRPTPDLGRLTVPGLDNMYLVGPFMHPGGGVFGAGRATAIKMFDDMNIDFDKVVGN
ncbi:phytoene dehydrogenase [Acinetobacter pittii]|jgi:phytoene dehydrogenase-like protein|nr:NAD(P)/FAD-dependent oxidoreductase [Acinetobacter pittii]MBJ8503198.1 NAD(P)/FAD-dependent oxidoreductase [Acinetobacter pittii]MBJ9894240.1 NAD(P)/FAD-dependent oxidoreductase [Acinetobacter pittii]MCU4480393.1 NAD(P)/FAD-dependent oxidoreductase [Acinetobacter sp. WU_MDCI_Abxd143]OTU29102.1 phytoene dehydrogenase [Acinetobacter pittii]